MTSSRISPAKNHLWVALDVRTRAHALRLVEQLRGRVSVYKVGLELFTSLGPSVVRAIRGQGGRVFLDLKFNDIPNTVAGAVAAVSRLDIDYVNVHALGGGAMIAAAVGAAEEAARRVGLTPPKVLAVTVLTSIDDDIIRTELGLPVSTEELVVRLAKLAQRSGAAGVIASLREVKSIRAACGPNFIIATPGIRPAWQVGKDDQRRVGTPEDAIRLGASAVIVGRPIIEGPSPRAAASRILTELRAARR